MTKENLTITVQGWFYGSKFNDEEDVWAFEEDRSKICFATIIIKESGMMERINIECNNTLLEDEINLILDKKVTFKNVQIKDDIYNCNYLYIAESFDIKG